MATMRPAAWRRMRPRPLGAAAPSRAERFARRVARRHGRAPGWRRPAAGLVLRRAVGTGAAGRITVRAVVRLVRQVVAAGPAADGAQASLPPAARPGGPGERLVRRLASRDARLDSVAPTGQARPPLAPAAAPASPAPPPPVPRVVRRPADGAASPSADGAAPARATRTGLVRQGASAAPVGDAELGRLADRVVEAIDRRLVAQRERMGRR